MNIRLMLMEEKINAMRLKQTTYESSADVLDKALVVLRELLETDCEKVTIKIGNHNMDLQHIIFSDFAQSNARVICFGIFFSC